MAQAQPDPAQNPDLAPTEPKARTQTWLDLSSLWIGLVVGVPTYYLAGSLVDLGMSSSQALSTVFLANLLLIIPLFLTAHPGTRYGIPFPVLARSSFGIHGSNVVTVMRGLVGCGWFGIESWIGGQAIYVLLPEKLTLMLPYIYWLGTSGVEFLCFLVFWGVQLGIVWRGMEGVRVLERFSAPVLIVLTAALLGWAYVNAGGFGHVFTLSSRLSGPEFWALFFPSLTANISFWATVALNIPDFTRYARSQKDQIIGQIGLPIFMGVFTFVGLAVTSSTEVIFGKIISNPIQLLAKIGGLTTMILAITGISLATITTNIAANVVAPANALVNLNPSVFTFQKGALLTALLGIAFQPWRLLKSSESFVYTWLVGYSALLGPIGGIIIADYYLLKKMKLNIQDLYSSSSRGEYYYSGGYNLIAMVSLVAGILPVMPGFLNNVGIIKSVPNVFLHIYNNAWFFGFFSAGFLHWFLSCLVEKPTGENEVIDPLLPKTI
ncbi:hypothetical protein Droror1_Dr00026257 [Drosera rotundifolia]